MTIGWHGAGGGLGAIALVVQAAAVARSPAAAGWPAKVSQSLVHDQRTNGLGWLAVRWLRSAGEISVGVGGQTFSSV